MSAMLLSMMRHQSKGFVSSGTFVVPAGVYCLFVDMVGGGGGHAGAGASGGAGGWVQSFPLAVVPGETLEIVVGLGGTNLPTGASGAAAPGGASYIARGGQRILSVGGGGGASRDSNESTASVRRGGNGGLPNGAPGAAGSVANYVTLAGGVGLGVGAGGGYTVGVAGGYSPAVGEFAAKSSAMGGRTPFGFGSGGYSNNSFTPERDVIPATGAVALRWVGNDPAERGLSSICPPGLPARVLKLTADSTLIIRSKEIEVLYLYGTAGGGGNSGALAGGGAGGWVWDLPFAVQYNDILDITIPAGGAGNSNISTMAGTGGDLTIVKNGAEALKLWGGAGGYGSGGRQGGDGGFPNGSGGGSIATTSVKYSGGCGIRRTNTQLSQGNGHYDGATAGQRLFGLGPLPGCGQYGGCSYFPDYGAGGKSTSASGEPGVLYVVYFSAEELSV